MEERIDKYLYAMRIYKSRSISTDACKKGRIKMGGVELKPSRTIKIGDVFTVRKGAITYTYKVLRLCENRLGAKLVSDYIQDITTPDQLELLELTKMNHIGRDRGMGRPTKKDRREIESFISSDYEMDYDVDLDVIDDDFED